MYFELISEISEVERIARGPSVRDRVRLRKKFGGAVWRKLNGRIRMVELHWYEAHGIGKKEIKRKRYLD